MQPRRSHLRLGGLVEVERWRMSREKGKWPRAGRSVRGHAVCPCLPCPQRGPRRAFLKCLTTPQAASKPTATELLCHWPKVIQYLSTYWCVFFEGETPRNIFYASRSSWGKDHKQSLLCQLAFYCDVLIWHCGLEEPSVDTGGGIQEIFVCYMFLPPPPQKNAFTLI